MTLPNQIQDLIQEYLEENRVDQTWKQIKDERKRHETTLSSIVRSFRDDNLSFKAFHDQLQKTGLFDRSGCWWRVQEFLTKLSKLAEHPNSDSIREDINKALGVAKEKGKGVSYGIEEFYKAQQDRRSAAGEPSVVDDLDKESLLFLEDIAYVISLISFWLDPSGESYIYTPEVLSGHELLVAHGLAPALSESPLDSHEFQSPTARQYKNIQNELEGPKGMAKLSTSPKTDDPYWVECFFSWIVPRLSQGLPSTSEPSSAPDEHPYSTLPEPSTSKDAKLLPMDKTQLKERIAEVRLRVLVDVDVIQRIYRALLIGHVILVGPPGTGKTELARSIPELLWQRPHEDAEPPTAYTTTLVTATNEWSTRTLIGGIVPSIGSNAVSYRIQYGYLAEAIFENWEVKREEPNTWQSLQRTQLEVESQLDGQGGKQTYRGRWLVIDEFNRAQIDIALGEALTALDGGIPLRVPAANESGTALLSIPKDFRIIGTLNSFDRSYLNQISEALKRRFSFVEVQPPSRKYRKAERAIVLYKALKEIEHLSDDIKHSEDKRSMIWRNYVRITPSLSLDTYTEVWEDSSEISDIREITKNIFDVAWRIFEVIRIYRKLGTAQAITLFRQLLLTRHLGEETQNTEQYLEQIWEALDAALCDTLADQMQVLLPDELDVLIWFLTYEKTMFIQEYRAILTDVTKLTLRRFRAHVAALRDVVVDEGYGLSTIVQTDKREEILKQLTSEEILIRVFHLDAPRRPYNIPQFVHRLRNFQNERV